MTVPRRIRTTRIKRLRYNPPLVPLLSLYFIMQQNRTTSPMVTPHAAYAVRGKKTYFSALSASDPTPSSTSDSMEFPYRGSSAGGNSIGGGRNGAMLTRSESIWWGDLDSAIVDDCSSVGDGTAGDGEAENNTYTDGKWGSVNESRGRSGSGDQRSLSSLARMPPSSARAISADELSSPNSDGKRLGVDPQADVEAGSGSVAKRRRVHDPSMDGGYVPSGGWASMNDPAVSEKNFATGTPGGPGAAPATRDVTNVGTCAEANGEEFADGGSQGRLGGAMEAAAGSGGDGSCKGGVGGVPRNGPKLNMLCPPSVSSTVVAPYEDVIDREVEEEDDDDEEEKDDLDDYEMHGQEYNDEEDYDCQEDEVMNIGIMSREYPIVKH